MPGELVQSRRVSPHCGRTNETSASESELKPVLDIDSGEEGKQQWSLCKNISRENVKHVSVVCMLCLLEMFASSTDSIMEGYFPIMAAEKGITTFATGVIFGVSPLFMMIVTPFCGYFLPKLGVKLTLTCGILLYGGAFFLTGFLIDMPSGAVFVTFGIFLRSIGGVGWALCSTTMFSLISHLFPSNMGKVTGLLWSSCGMGHIIGPPIGSLLIVVGGYRTLFLVMGGIILLFIPLTILLVKPTSSSSEIIPLKTVLKLLSSFGFSVLLLCNVILNVAMLAIDTTVAVFLLNEIGLNKIAIGLVFALMSASYFLCTMPSGSLSDKFGPRKFVISGLFIGGISLIIIGLTAYNSVLPHWWVIFSFLIIFCVGIALIEAPLYSSLFKQASDHHSQDKEDDNEKDALNNVVSGITAFSQSFGEFIGAVLGGLITHFTNFYTTALLMGEVMTAQAILILGVTVIDCIHSRRHA